MRLMILIILFLIEFSISNCANVGPPPNLTNYQSWYCDIKCAGEQHTMCQFKGRSSSCKEFHMTYTPVKAASLLDEINSERNKFADSSSSVNRSIFPLASNMRLVVWNYELATIAFRWLSQCIIGHDKCRNTVDEEVGQTIAFYKLDTRSELPQMTTAFQEWAGERELVKTNDSMQSFTTENNRIHNFTQIYWAETNKIGCSEVTYSIDYQLVVGVACNYAPKGNVPGQSVYQFGDPCSACPERTECHVDENYEFLCGTRTDLGEDFLVFDPDESTSDCVQSSATLLLLGTILQRVGTK